MRDIFVYLWRRCCHYRLQGLSKILSSLWEKKKRDCYPGAVLVIAPFPLFAYYHSFWVFFLCKCVVCSHWPWPSRITQLHVTPPHHHQKRISASMTLNRNCCDPGSWRSPHPPVMTLDGYQNCLPILHSLLLLLALERRWPDHRRPTPPCPSTLMVVPYKPKSPAHLSLHRPFLVTLSLR